MNKEFVIKAVKDAVGKHRTPLILNGDQGSQFTSHEYVETLEELNIKISMVGKGRASDNAITKRSWRYGAPGVAQNLRNYVLTKESIAAGPE